MKIHLQAVAGASKVSSAGIVMVPRKKAESHGVVPGADAIGQTKERFRVNQIDAMITLIEAVQSCETSEAVLGYFGFTYDHHRLTSTPLEPGETQNERGMKILRLPHPQWGNRHGTATVLNDLVRLAAHPILTQLNDEQRALMNEAFSHGAMFLVRSTTEGSS